MSENRYIEQLVKFRERSSKTIATGDLGHMEICNAAIGMQRTLSNRWPETLTKYCSIEVALSIISVGEFWLTDVRKMNDSSEFVFARDYLHEQIQKLKQLEGMPLGLFDVVNEDFAYWTSDELTRNGTQVYRGKLIMASCLTGVHDDVGMWDRYGNGFKGAAIHFGTDQLVKAFGNAGHFIPNASPHETGLSKVCYPDDSVNCSCVEKIVLEALQAYQSANTNDEGDLVRTLLFGELLRSLMSHKHPSFVSEQEYRVYTHLPIDKTWSGTDRVHLYDDGRRKFYYTTIFLPHWAIGVSSEEYWNELIRGVTMGPNSTQQDFEVIAEALASRGIDISPVKSSVPIRPDH